MKKILFVVVLAASLIEGRAQFVYDYLKAADNYYQKGDYASAAEYYEKYLTDKGGAAGEFNPYSPQRSSKKTVSDMGSRDKATFNLAESYRLLNYPSKAEPHYKYIVETKLQSYPLARYHYATQLRALGKYPEAEAAFKAFLGEYSSQDQYRINAERELKNLEFIQAQMNKKDLKYFKINKAGGDINTTAANYAAAWANAGQFYFTSTRPIDLADNKNNLHVNRIFQASVNGNEINSVNKTPIPHDEKMEQGVVAIAPGGNTMYLTRWKGNATPKNAAIYMSSFNGTEWNAPQKLSDAINHPGANTQQPFVTPDGKYLVFSSDRPGGMGGYDLWYATIDGNSLGAPANITSLNTSFDEQSPFYHQPSGSLVFATNGRVGMGDFDLFSSKGYFDKGWSEPMNLGYPVNSIKDDLYFTSNGPARNMLENITLSSDRDAACCLELFYLSKDRPLRQVSGSIVSCNPDKPLINATVTIVDTVNNKVIHTQAVSANGTYNFTIEDYQPLKVRAEAPGFFEGSLHADVPSDLEEERFTYPELCLMPVPPKVDEKFVVQNVYYDFDKATLKPESFPALDEIVRMLNFYPNMAIEISAHTDSKGSNDYNQRLSEARARSVVEYLVSKGIDPSRLESKGYGETMPIEPNEIDGRDNPAGRERNRRTEFKVLRNE